MKQFTDRERDRGGDAMVPQECIQHQEQLVVGEASQTIVDIPTVQDQVIIQEIPEVRTRSKLFQRSECNSTSSNKIWTSPCRAGLCREHSRSVRRVLWRQCGDVDYCRDVEQALCRWSECFAENFRGPQNVFLGYPKRRWSAT